MTRAARPGLEELSLAALAVVTVLGGTACDTQEGGLVNSFIPMLDLNPAGVDMEVGESTSLSPSLDGAPVPNDRPFWASDDPQVATVDAIAEGDLCGELDRRDEVLSGA